MSYALRAATLAVAFGCVEQLPEPRPCSDGKVFDGQGCACEAGLFEHRDSNDCVTCTGSTEVVDDDDRCAPCPDGHANVDGVCVDCSPPGAPAAPCFVPALVAASEAPSDGCVDLAGYDVYQCLTGAPDDDEAVQCQTLPEGAGEPTCYEPGPDRRSACPPDVDALAGAASASCFPLDPDGVVAGTEGVPCTCRDLGLLARCDGVGVMLGQVARAGPVGTAMTVMRPVFMQLPALPPSGRFGVFVRARGFAAPFYLLAASAEGTLLESWTFLVTKGYDDLVGFGLGEDGVPATNLEGLPYDPSSTPTTLLLTLPDLYEGIEQSAILEIDCVIPFVLPPP